MLDWWIETRLEGDQFEVSEDQSGDQQYQEEDSEEGKCSKGPLYLWILQFIYMHVSKFELPLRTLPRLLLVPHILVTYGLGMHFG